MRFTTYDLLSNTSDLHMAHLSMDGEPLLCTASISSGAPAILANFCSRLTDTCGLTFRPELVKGEIPNGREKKIACAKKKLGMW